MTERSRKSPQLIRRYPFFALLLVSVFAFSGCGQDRRKYTNAELQKAIARWQQKKISDYDFMVRKTTMSANGTTPLLIKVRKGKPESKEVIGEPGPMDRVEEFEDFATVDNAFETIQKAYDNGYHQVDVTYNEDLGYPQKMEFNPRPTIDTVHIIEITNFAIVQRAELPPPAPNGFYKNCWTSNNGNGMYISNETIQTRNSRKALKFKDVTDEIAVEKGVALLELQEKDESNELQKYLTLRAMPGDEMEARNYFTYEDFRNSAPDGVQSRWVRDDCKSVRPSLNRRYK
jgi:hypothetical protein